ncbi:Phytocyanin domain, partial [Dillenia turbinata]
MESVVGILILVVAAPAAYATQHPVGGSSGWTTGFDYTQWANGQTFVVVFSYGSSHGVDVVSQTDFTNCNTANALQSYSGGNTIISLNSTGTIYYICPTSGHCGQGMKLAVTVGASTTPVGSNAPPPPVSPPPPPPPKSGATQ